MIPEDRTYSSTHEWVKIDVAVVQMGVTEPLIRTMGPLVGLELPDPDDEMKLGIPIAVVESNEHLHEIMPPAAANILEVNKDLEWDLNALAEDPYGEGWLMKIKVHEPDHLRDLMTPEMYREHCQDIWGEELDLNADE